MSIGDAFRRLARAFKAAGQAYGSSSKVPEMSSGTGVRSVPETSSIAWQTSPDDPVVICGANDPAARLIAVASLYGVVQVRVCQKNMPPEQFRAEFSMAYTYGPGGSERSGTDVHLSFTSEDELLARVQDEKEWDERKPAGGKLLPRFKVAETTFLWAIVRSKSRHFQFPAKQ